jgi:mono/diheme cytochrome c family protein
MWLALVALAGCGDASIPDDDPRAGPHVTKVAEGGKLYVQHCAICHGTKLKGQPNWRPPESRSTALCRRMHLKATRTICRYAEDTSV